MINSQSTDQSWSCATRGALDSPEDFGLDLQNVVYNARDLAPPFCLAYYFLHGCLRECFALSVLLAGEDTVTPSFLRVLARCVGISKGVNSRETWTASARRWCARSKSHRAPFWFVFTAVFGAHIAITSSAQTSGHRTFRARYHQCFIFARAVSWFVGVTPHRSHQRRRIDRGP